jgi:outer membrane protein OmpA-like peptidoglycan-associated protein
MINRLSFLIIFLALNYVNLSAQGEGNIWYFGKGYGLDFNDGEPKLLKDGALNTFEGVASMSDNNGNLLFYTDGQKVWNAKHEIMPNGDGLMGDSSATQSAVIVPKPRSRSTYYIFTIDAAENGLGNGLRYCEVNMLADSGYGELKYKNKPLASPTCEKITATVHENQKDFWVITHEWNTDRFLAFLITEKGVEEVAYPSVAGSKIRGEFENGAGYMKVSPNGKRLANTIYLEDRVELFDFDNSTGEVSNRIKLPKTAKSAYGVEFSPDSDKLFVGSFGTGIIEQYDLGDYTQAAISKSRVEIKKESNFNLGALQLGPDGRMYFTSLHHAYISVIINPNDYGSRCRIRERYIMVGKNNGRLGLPTFIQTYFSTGAVKERETILAEKRAKNKTVPEAAAVVTAEVPSPPPPPVTFQLCVQVKEKIYQDPNDPNSMVTGLKALPGSTVNLDTEKKVINYQVDGKAEIRLQLKQDGVYHFVCSKNGYLNSGVDYISKDKLKNDTVVVVLDRIFPEKEIVLEDIYYDYDKANLRADAIPKLDNLLKILKDNEGIRIQLSSHTDCRGEDDYNIDLSQRRAQSVVDYLIESGIDAEVLIAKGYGETSPAADCNCTKCSEDEHQENRRTTFKILSN